MAAENIECGAWSTTSEGSLMNTQQSANKMPRAFIVDDDEDSLAIISYLFESAEVDVVRVIESTKAIDEFKANAASGGDFDLVALDIRMPNIDGNELARQIRQTGYRGPIIALTANASGGGRRVSKASGFDYYFGKVEVTKNLVLGLLQK